MHVCTLCVARGERGCEGHSTCGRWQQRAPGAVSCGRNRGVARVCEVYAWGPPGPSTYRAALRC
jgi:hypothetical protein